jgi:beta-phosphoglucomutase
MSVKAIIFDLDGVITDTAEYHYLAWKRLAEKLAIPFDRAANESLKGIDRMGSLEFILANCAQQFSSEEKYQLAEEKNRYYQSLVETMTSADLLPGAAQLLEVCKQLGLRIALASASKNAFTVLARLGITDQFDFVVDAATIVHGKPDPEIFLAAAQGVSCEPSECIGIEDAAAGVSAIKTAGMFAIGVGEPAVLDNANVVVADLTKLSIADYL